jgi:hypothetical protein
LINIREKDNLICHFKRSEESHVFVEFFTRRIYNESILKFSRELNMDIKNIKEMFKKNEESKSSIVKSNVIINTKDYALENELNKIIKNYPILNYINQNLESMDIKNTLKEIKLINEDAVSQNIKNVQILKTFLFKK